MKQGSAVKFFFVLSVILLLPGSLFSQNKSDPDTVIARVWLERAYQLLNSRENQSAESLNQASRALETALEYQNPPGRDALFLQAELLLAGGPETPGIPPVQQACELLSQSLDLPSDFSSGRTISSFEQRAVLWCSQALRLREYREILDRYESWPRGERDSPVLLYAAGRAALYLGLNKQAAELSKRGEALSVHGTDLSLLGASFSNAAEPAFRALAIAAGDSRSISALDAGFMHWPITFEEALRPWLLSGFIGIQDIPELSGYISPELNRILSALNNTGESALTLSRDYVMDLALLRRLRNTDGIDALLSGFTGLLEADADYDGYPEETVDFVNGKLKSRRIDRNQDGLYECEITYEDGIPVQSRYLSGNIGISLLYDKPDYPAVLGISYQDRGTHTDLTMNPGAFTWRVEGDDGFWDLPRVPGKSGWDENLLWNGTRKVVFSGDNPAYDSYSVTVTYLSAGYPVRAVERNFSSRDKENLLWLREIIYEDGVPAAGRRSYRRDPEHSEKRLWELYERYEKGKLVGLAWDPGMTGIPVYLRDWALDRYLETQIWDLDADGWMDFRRLNLPDGKQISGSLFITEARREDLLPWTASDWSPWEE